MAISSILSTATSGLLAAGQQAAAAANNIANIDTPGYQQQQVATTSVVSSTSNPAGGSGVATQLIVGSGPPDVAASVVDLLRASDAFKANATLLRTASQISRSTLDILA